MTAIVTKLSAHDVRFPTSQDLDGSDAMNADPDYSASYVTLHTDTDGLEGHGLTFTIGRGNELCVAAIESLAPLVIGKSLDSFAEHPGDFWKMLTGDSQLRWVGPEKGVIHLATAAIINALWDLHAKAQRKPVWRLLCEMSPQQLVDCVDFRYLTDVITPNEALAMLDANMPSRSTRIAEMLERGYPTYTTSAGWLGYSDEKLRDLCRELMSRGWSDFKIKVGRDLQDDLRRCRIIREEIGWKNRLMMDANQVWDVGQAIEHIKHLAEFKPWFMEEPTSPDDVLGHAKIARAIAPIKVATGEMCHNRIMFKQFMQAGGMQICQLDSCRLAGINEIIAVMLMAKKFDIPVCPHSGGVGLCEYVQHLAIFDYVCVSASLDDRIAEYADHLHEHFVDPVVMRDGHYMPPSAPGYSAEMKADSIEQFTFPAGAAWSSRVQKLSI